eukprot:1163470-Amphidinium_carterae.1
MTGSISFCSDKEQQTTNTIQNEGKQEILSKTFGGVLGRHLETEDLPPPQGLKNMSNTCYPNLLGQTTGENYRYFLALLLGPWDWDVV